MEHYRKAVGRLPEKIIAAVGLESFQSARVQGSEELRLPFLLEPDFFDLLADPLVLGCADVVLGPAATLRFFNIAITPPSSATTMPRSNADWHQNFKVFLAGPDRRPLLLDLVIPLSNPGTRLEIVPGSHTMPQCPNDDWLAAHAINIEPRMGEMLVMSPFLWHRELANSCPSDMAGVFLQLSRPFIKPHADYMRAVDAATLARLPERTRRLLGSYTQLPTSLTEFYLPPEQRPYRPGQW